MVRILCWPHLANLTPEELYILLKNIRHVFAEGDEGNYLVPDEAIQQFLAHCQQTIGEAYFRTPRNTVKAFLDMLAVIEQNPQISWQQLVGDIHIEEEKPSDMDIAIDDEDLDDDFADFKLWC